METHPMLVESLVKFFGPQPKWPFSSSSVKRFSHSSIDEEIEKVTPKNSKSE